MIEDQLLILSLVGVVVTAVFALFAAVITTRQRAAEALLDDLAARVAALELQNKAQANYIVELRGHIFDQKPPPPPPWPSGLTR